MMVSRSFGWLVLCFSIIAFLAGTVEAGRSVPGNNIRFGLSPFEIITGRGYDIQGGPVPSVLRYEAAAGWISADYGDGSNIVWMLQGVPLRSFLLPAVRPSFLTASFFGDVAFDRFPAASTAPCGVLGPAVLIELTGHPDGALPLTNIAALSSRSSGFDTFRGSFSRSLENLGNISLGARFSGHPDGFFGLKGYTALLQPSPSLDLFCAYSSVEGAWSSPVDYLEYAPFGGSEERFDAGFDWRPNPGSGRHGHRLYTRIVNVFRLASLYDMSFYSFHESAAGYSGSFKAGGRLDIGLNLEGGLVNGGLYEESGYYRADSIGTWSCSATFSGSLTPDGAPVTCNLSITAEYERFAGAGGGARIDSEGPFGSFVILESGGRPRSFFETMAGKDLPGRERGVWLQAGLVRTPAKDVTIIPRLFFRASDPCLFWQKHGVYGTFSVEERRATIYGFDTFAAFQPGEGAGELSARYSYAMSEISGFGRKPWLPIHELELRCRSPFSLFSGRMNAEAGGFGRVQRCITTHDGETMEWLPGYFTAGGSVSVTIRTLSALFILEYYPNVDQGNSGFLGWRLGIDWNFIN